MVVVVTSSQVLAGVVVVVVVVLISAASQVASTAGRAATRATRVAAMKDFILIMGFWLLGLANDLSWTLDAVL